MSGELGRAIVLPILSGLFVGLVIFVVSLAIIGAAVFLLTRRLGTKHKWILRLALPIPLTIILMLLVA